MKTRPILIAFLLLAFLPLRADEDGPTVYLWVRNVSTLTNKLAQIDTALGYPCSTTLTYRAISYDMLSNGTNAIVRLDLDAIWSVKASRYIDWQQAVKNQLTDTQWGTEIVTNVAGLAGKPVARISGQLARQIGIYYLTNQ